MSATSSAIAAQSSWRDVKSTPPSDGQSGTVATAHASAASAAERRRHEAEVGEARDLLAHCQLDLELSREREAAAKSQALRLQEQVSALVCAEHVGE